jgi:hypothetical protein
MFIGNGIEEPPCLSRRAPSLARLLTQRRGGPKAASLRGRCAYRNVKVLQSSSFFYDAFVCLTITSDSSAFQLTTPLNPRARRSAQSPPAP